MNIAWSSSGSEQSDNETQEQHLSRGVVQQQQRPRRPSRPTAPIQSYTRALRMLGTDKGEWMFLAAESGLGNMRLLNTHIFQNVKVLSLLSCHGVDSVIIL